ncbi:c-type cytochrome [Ferrovum myxofaciens]|uniref:C-type cytochrome n=2 Tax=root TaxID=1 RepID=A0A8F3DXQ4_9PROT|nr:c-type cytochrome [Ferrovum myxofaciens]MBW8028656.1 c-type cytochrome [Ferrovum sp.]KXW57552.1 cytochrome c-551 precursor [Ferrovum myxofaciens]MBU6995837.1 c-type cytochrome [Ferrovum myxofaciens]NDU90629.1 c-type cytochrome [Ferrovum sp.]QKE39380.1 MAG: c-type cytochrome [Ferrovum myxofaciens]
MKSWKTAVMAVGLLLGTVAAHADNGLELAKKSGCLSCHSVDTPKVGPSYKSVAAKYRGQPGAEAKLIAKVTRGGSGSWGMMPMPAKGGNANLSEEDIKNLVKWILSR